MSWIETITKEGFQLAVREAMRSDLEKIENRIGNLEQRVSRLEGSVDANMRAYEANVRVMFSEFKSEMFQRLLDYSQVQPSS